MPSVTLYPKRAIGVFSIQIVLSFCCVVLHQELLTIKEIVCKPIVLKLFEKLWPTLFLRPVNTCEIVELLLIGVWSTYQIL